MIELLRPTISKVISTVVFLILVVILLNSFECNRLAVSMPLEKWSGNGAWFHIGGDYNLPKIWPYFLTGCNDISFNIIEENAGRVVAIARIAVIILSVIIFYFILCLVINIIRQIKLNKKTWSVFYPTTQSFVLTVLFIIIYALFIVKPVDCQQTFNGPFGGGNPSYVMTRGGFKDIWPYVVTGCPVISSERLPNDVQSVVTNTRAVFAVISVVVFYFISCLMIDYNKRDKPGKIQHSSRK